MQVVQVHANTSWFKVSFSERSGYVLSKYVLLGGNSSYRAGTVTTSLLNVRNAAGTGNAIIGKLTGGATVIVTGTAQAGGATWYKIACGSQAGYVHGNLIRVSPSPLKSTLAAAPPAFTSLSVAGAAHWVV